MRIDAHQHFWQLSRGDYGWLTPDLGPIYRDFGPDDLKPLIKAARIDRTILVQAAPTEAETAFLLEIARNEPMVAGVVGWADFDALDIEARIAAVAQETLLVGLRPMIQDIADPDWMLSPRVDSALRAMARHGLVFDALVKPVHLANLLELATRHPQLIIVIDHCAKPDIAAGHFESWSNAMARLATLPHVAVKLSGLLTEAGLAGAAAVPAYLQRALQLFGVNRAIFGSDWPVLNLCEHYVRWINIVEEQVASLSGADRAAIMGGNAARLYLSARGRR